MNVRHICTLLAMLTFFAACGQAPVAQPTTAPTPAPTLVGSWTTTATKADLLRVAPDFKQEFLCDNAGTFVWQFKGDGTFTIDQTALEGCPKLTQTHVESTWASAANLVTFAKGTADQKVYSWAVDGDMLTFSYQSGNCLPCKATNTANPWKRLGS